LNDFLKVKGKVLEARARLVVDLLDLQHLCRPSRTWVTRDEWVAVCGRGRPWSDWSSAKRALMRQRRDLEELLGVDLHIETTDSGDHRVYVDTGAIRDALEPHARRARLVLHESESRQRGLEASGELAPSDLNVQEVARDYQDRKRPLAILSRKYGMGRDRIRKALEGARVKIRKQRRMRISEKVGPDVTAKALETHDRGASLESVRKILGCATKWSAHRFLRAHDRDTKPASERDLPPPRAEPPRWPARSATCASRPTSKPLRASG
jgi:hypothetical protein